jgi:3',5'-cyclic AMP phosphodiesterase CpdA
LIAVIGDTQRTLLLERFVLRREQNDAERVRLLADLVASEPDLLVHLGDAVAIGGRTADWTRFDRLTATLVQAGIPVFPVVGNHDRWGSSRRAMGHFRARFPLFPVRGWYARRHGRLRMIWLDTNADRLTGAAWSSQARWFEREVAQADEDDETAGVVVFAHHPPYTNSRLTSDSAVVQVAFLGPFCAARKTLTFIAGHTHAYERFVERGKTFVVAGGGGGPRVRLRHGDAARHADQFAGPSPRPFHYLALRPGSDGLHVEVRGLDKGGVEARELERFTLRYHA